MDTLTEHLPLSPVTIGLLGSIGVVSVYLLTRKQRLSNMPPGPTQYPIVGSMFSIIGSGDEVQRFHLNLHKITEDYGKITTIKFGSIWMIFLNDFDVIKEAFVTKGIDVGGRYQDKRLESINPLFPKNGGILFGSYSDEWKKQRHNALYILRSFGYGKHSLEMFIQEEVQRVLRALKSTGAQAFDPQELIEVSVSNVICSLLFGTRYEHGDKDFKEILADLNLWFKQLSASAETEFLPALKYVHFGYWRTKKILTTTGAKIQKFYKKRIDEGKRHLAEGGEPKDFITSYLAEVQKIDEGGAKISEDWLVSLVHDFFLAGSETTATTLKWALLRMALNQDKQQKVHQEIDKVKGVNGPNQFLLSDRDALSYIEACLMETQRKHPVAPIGVAHEVTTDGVTLAGYNIPKGAAVVPNLASLLNNPQIWNDPQEFRPERFLGDDGKILKKEEWIPFSMGRRTCLGEQLARQEMFLVFSHIMDSFYIRIPEGADPPSDKGVYLSVVKPDPYQVCFVPRHKV